MLRNEVEQVNALKYLGSLITEKMPRATETRTAEVKETFIQIRKLLYGPLNKDLWKRLAEV